MKTLLMMLAFLLVGVAPAQTLTEDPDDFAGSGFPRKVVNPYISRTARSVGDLLTIVINESSSSNYSATTTATKKDENSVAKATLPFLSMLKIPLIDQIIGGLSTGADSKVSGAGTTTQNGRFNAKITVVVREVMPNGTMIVEGTRWVKVNREDQNITFAGIVRRDDVRSDNTVFSENVADARITSMSKGLIADRQRRGIITRIIDWLF